MAIPMYLTSEMHLQNSLTERNSKLNRKFPSTSLRKSEESRARIALDQENRSSQLAEGPHQFEINFEKRFLGL